MVSRSLLTKAENEEMQLPMKKFERPRMASDKCGLSSRSVFTDVTEVFFSALLRKS